MPESSTDSDTSGKTCTQRKTKHLCEVFVKDVGVPSKHSTFFSRHCTKQHITLKIITTDLMSKTKLGTHVYNLPIIEFLAVFLFNPQLSISHQD